MTDRPDAENESEDETDALTWYHRRKSIRYKVVNSISRMTRGRIASPYIRSITDFHRRRDASENEKSRPADSQHFKTWVVWAVEAYTPANISGLIEGLSKLQPVQRGPDRDPVAWLRKNRYNPGSSLELYLHKPGSSPTMGFHLDVPAFVEYGAGTIWTATPSLTLLTMMFVLTDEERSRFETALKADYTTRIEPTNSHGAMIFSPELERRRAIRETRADWSRQASDWFGKHFPGLFCVDGEPHPTSEVTTADGLEPFPDRWDNRRDGSILTALNWNGSDPFVPSDLASQGLFYTPFPGHGGDDTRHALVAATREAFERQEASGWGDGEDRFLYPFDRLFRPIVAQWAILHVLALYRRKVSSARDGFANVIGRQSALRALGKVRLQTADCADAATVARGINEGIADHALRVYHAGLTLKRRSNDDEERRMDMALRETLTWRANGLLRDVSELNETLHAQASLLSAHANLRLQPWIIVLAVVSFVAGAIAAIGPARELLGWQPKATAISAAPARIANPQGSKGQARNLGRIHPAGAALSG